MLKLLADIRTRVRANNQIMQIFSLCVKIWNCLVNCLGEKWSKEKHFCHTKASYQGNM